MDPRDARLQDLLDRQDLADLVLRYCRCIDRRQFDKLRPLYHADARHDHGGMFQGNPADLIAWLSRTTPAAMVTHHFVGNMLFQVDGDRAEGEIYTINTHRFPAATGARDYIASGRYLDRYERRNGVWRFSFRQRIADWTHEGAAQPAAMAAGLRAGATDGSDPSFALRTLAAL